MSRKRPRPAQSRQPASPVVADLRRIGHTSLALTRETDPAERIILANSLAESARWLLANVVNEAHANGATWQQIADTLGITRQSAHRRFVHVLQDRPLPLNEADL